jgi:hypothetical protein
MLLLAFLALRTALALLPGYPPDLETFKRWAVWGGVKGIHTFYDVGSNYDYPPLYGYLLSPFGRIEEEIDPSNARRFLQVHPNHVTKLPYSAGFSLLVKTPPLLFDLALAGLVGVLAYRHGLWRRRSSWQGWAPALLFLFHPACLFVSAYLGHPDSIHTFFVLGALSLILLDRPGLGWVAAALGSTMKPLAAPFIPLLILLTFSRYGFIRSVRAGSMALITLVVLFAPYWLSGRGELMVTRLITDLEAYPFTSVNGHNLWWLYGGWESADVPLWGPLTARHLGLLFFGISYALILAWVMRTELIVRRSSQAPDSAKPGRPRNLYADRHWYLAAAATAFCFFVLSTHMHENHLYQVIPFLLLFAGWGTSWAWLFAIVSMSIFVNLVNHDLFIGNYVLSKIGGISEFYVQGIQWYKGLGEDISRPSYLSNFELYVSYVNSLVTLACWTMLMILGIRSMTPTDAGDESPPDPDQ